MPITEIGKKSKPYVIGGVCGVALIAAVAFGAGWVVTSSAQAQAVTSARVQELAKVCAEHATAYWKSENKDMKKLQQWDAWDARGKLAKKFAADLPDRAALGGKVRSACADMLAG